MTLHAILCRASAAAMAVGALGLAVGHAQAPSRQQTQYPVESDAHRMGAGCPQLGQYKSPPSTARTTIDFTSRVDRAVTVYWIDFKGNPVDYGGLVGNNKLKFDTFVGHYWIAKDFDGRCYGGVFQARAGANRIVVAAAPPQPAAPQVAQAPAAGPFDKPVSVQKLPKKPGSDVEVSCTYYPDIMVRETTDGPTSTDAAIVRGARPPCSAGKVAGEIAAKTADHSLLGRKGPFLVFSFMDPHGAVPFVVVDSGSGRVVFSDATVGNPEIRGAAIESDALRLRYRRGVNADCSIMKDARGCWAKLVKAGNIPAAMAQQVPSPRICDAAYKKTKATPDNTSIVIYDTEMRIDAKGTAQVLTSGPVACDAQP